MVFKITKQKNNNYIILDKNNNSFIGNIEVILKENIVEIILSIVKNMQHLHYGTEAILATMDYCNKTFNVKEFELYVYKNNINAINCYKKIGFVPDGLKISEDDIHMKLKRG